MIAYNGSVAHECACHIRGKERSQFPLEEIHRPVVRHQPRRVPQETVDLVLISVVYSKWLASRWDRPPGRSWQAKPAHPPEYNH